MATIDELLEQTKGRMGKAVDALRGDLTSIRTGRATPSLLDRIKVDYYGTPTPINQVANISVPEPRMMLISPWEKNMIKPIEKAIQMSDLGINPNSDGSGIRLNLPQPTEERRKELVKSVNKHGEACRIEIRNIRRDVNEAIKKQLKAKTVTEDASKAAIEKAQKLTDQCMKDIDRVLAAKEKEVMEV